ncbi:cupin domain-containing protein [Paenibacillus silvisoli]|uniref:cupin domain-containing protein n=1 Tax=Paenibacillus silvisoli TaxID=3110539 RepID=UPI002805793E|nr:cupin domain-containing protein [Paenibacillus silvisoli]
MPVNYYNSTQVYPEWSELSHYGINHLKVGDIVQLHYHDANEYWIIISGRGTCTTEGDTYEIGPGDMVLTKRGDEHSLVVTEEMVAVYIYGIMPEGGRVGYLFKGVDDVK